MRACPLFGHVTHERARIFGHIAPKNSSYHLQDNFQKYNLFHEICELFHEISDDFENSHLFQLVKIVTIFKVGTLSLIIIH
jgi:hypothetical protein